MKFMRRAVEIESPNAFRNRDSRGEAALKFRMFEPRDLGCYEVLRTALANLLFRDLCSTF